jgi:hypothetical protein
MSGTAAEAPSGCGSKVSAPFALPLLGRVWGEHGGWNQRRARPNRCLEVRARLGGARGRPGFGGRRGHFLLWCFRALTATGAGCPRRCFVAM